MSGGDILPGSLIYPPSVLAHLPVKPHGLAVAAAAVCVLGACPMAALLRIDHSDLALSKAASAQAGLEGGAWLSRTWSCVMACKGRRPGTQMLDLDCRGCHPPGRTALASCC